MLVWHFLKIPTIIYFVHFAIVDDLQIVLNLVVKQHPIKNVIIHWRIGYLSNLFYILEKNLNNQIAKLSVKDILYFANVVTVGHDDAKLALDLDVADFEDALQIVSAKAVDADYIITRNKKDFVNSPIMAILPEEVGLVG